MLDLEYCAKAIVRYLNGDMDLFKSYRDKAIEIYENEKNTVSVRELIPKETREKLYEMVN